jgi:hypothetical protein
MGLLLGGFYRAGAASLAVGEGDERRRPVVDDL